ncbi:MAG: hypothetical protein JW954_02070 [Dehalococcoidaceae bacterium]|nr:hypothetical protein [Dehalococcoidaceae bacterium]
MGKTEQQFREARRLERVLIILRWLYIPAILLTAWLYGWLTEPLIWVSAGGLAAVNLAAAIINQRVKSHRQQSLLGMAMLGADFMAGWGLIITGVNDQHTFIYTAFALIIVEAAMRFGLWGALAMDIIFGAVMRLTWWFSSSQAGTAFSLADYLLILGVMSFVSLMVGMVAREWRQQRRWAEILAGERALLLERRRISAELHDSVLKSLQGLSMEAWAWSQDKNSRAEGLVVEKSRYIQDICRLLSGQIRGVILELRDEGAPQDIIPVIESLTHAWHARTGISIELKCKGNEPAVGLKTAHDIQKITEEALLNIERHAQAGRVRLETGFENGQLWLDIQDDGCGFVFDPENLYLLVGMGRLGLVSIKERVELAGGTLKIESSPEGTRLCVRLPLKEATA